jgi:hypothetical protein
MRGLPVTGADTTVQLCASLNQRHNRLVSRWASGPPSADDAEAFMSDIIAAGAVVPPGPERDGLRNLLYFWASDQTIRGRRGSEASPPMLAPYTETSPAAAPSVAGVAEGATTEAASAAIVSDGATAATAPASGVIGTATRAGAASVWGGVVSQVLGSLHIGDAKKSAPAPASTSSASSGPPSDAQARAIVRIAALARQWRLTHEVNKKGYLLTGKALVEASLFVDRDPDIAALVAASEQQEKVTEKQTRLARRMLYGLVALAVFAILWVVYLGWQNAVHESALAKQEARWAKQESELKEAENVRLRNANTQRAAERDQIREKAQAAVDALSRDDLSPLKKLLENLGSANENDLKRLQLAPSTVVERASDATFTTPQRTAGAPAPPVAPPAGATCTGYLWFGSKADSRLNDGRDPATLKLGDDVTLDNRADIRLRADWPSDAYVMGRQIGVVPAGSQVKLSSEPKAYHRERGDQIWAQVAAPRTFCTTVFLQYSGTPDKRGAVVSALRDLGVQVPPAEKVAAAAGLAEVRYFWPDDEPVAQQVAAALSSFNGGNKLGVVLVKSVTTKPSQGTIEAWLDFSR